MLNIQKMMKQAQQVQIKLQEIQEKLKDIEVEGEAGGGLVKITLNCGGGAKRVSINEDLMNSDKETLEDLMVAAINMANQAKDIRIKEETEGALKGMDLPEGLADNMGGGLPF
ncbi:MAG: YbaB/EbfC family nucleoid-associated protein [Alphaproteobacteria bacterium]